MAAPTNYIEQHLAEDVVIDALAALLEDNFATETDDLFQRDSDNQTGTPGANSTSYTEGVYLPDPAFYYRQSAPSSEFKDHGHVSCFIGPTGPAERREERAETLVTVDGQDGAVWQMEQPFAVVFVFGRAPQDDITVDGRILRPEEIMRKRASYYAGAIAHTVSKYANGTTALWGTIPGARDSSQAEIEIGADEYALIGFAAYEFTVINHQLFPMFG